MASDKHIAEQLSTEEQNRRYEARTPEQQERRRIVRKMRRKSRKDRNKHQHGMTLSDYHRNLNSLFAALPDDVVCLDLEQYEWEQELLTEIGITKINTTTSVVSTTHIIINEHYDRRNCDFVCDNKDHFLHGDSVRMSLVDGLNYIRPLFASTHFVGHNINGDFKYLRTHQNLPQHLNIRLCTDKLFCALHQRKQGIGLSKVCEHYGIEHTHPHNAGNDSHANALAFLALMREYNQRSVENT